MKQPTSQAPKYLAELLKRQKAGEFKPGTVSIAEIKHDDWCDLLNARRMCNCDPEVEIRKA